MSIGLTRILQQITGLNTFFSGPNAGRVQGVVLEDSDTVAWTTDGYGNIQATAAPGMTLIQEQVLDTSVTSVTFAAIPQTYKHLKVVAYVNSAEPGTAVLRMTFNSDSTLTDYYSIQSSGFSASAPNIGLASDGVSSNEILIPSYTNAALEKVATCVAVDNLVPTILTTGLNWTIGGTAAITALTFTTQNNDNMLTGSVFSLYGLN